MAASPTQKTLIGVLASHDDAQKNAELAELFKTLWSLGRSRFGDFHFVFTGGTFDRLLLGDPPGTGLLRNEEVREHLLKGNSTRLPKGSRGGVAILAQMIVQRQCSILWPFLSPVTPHWLSPENLALMRLCDIWNEKRYMNSGSAKSWFMHEAERDCRRNLQPIPIELRSALSPHDDPDVNLLQTADDSSGYHTIELPEEKPDQDELWGNIGNQTIALIAHDQMKDRMVDFAIEYERELGQFARILTTGTTGHEVLSATRFLTKTIERCRSGPKGGDIEIAAEVLFGRCHVVVFFVDALRPHAHIEDIRVVFGACMIQNSVRMLSNELQAREWMDLVIRGKESAP